MGGVFMDSIPFYDDYKLASPYDDRAEQEIDAIERGLDVCPFCFGPSYFEDSAHGWYVTCSSCGVSMPGDEPVRRRVLAEIGALDRDRVCRQERSDRRACPELPRERGDPGA